MEIAPTDVAWFAGLFEGEGWFETSKRSTVRMALRMSDLDVVERVNRMFPCNGVVVTRSDRGFKTLYEWRISKADRVVEIIRLAYPYFGERRRSQADNVLSHAAKRQRSGEPRKAHCKQGHAMTQDNLVRRDRGYVRCATCARAVWRASNARRRAVETA